ncbi:Restriction endonuclease BglII [Turneriella parva DSM 21527]|uniref:Restriction endonuclease BglII n=2 Tax=Turneriella TaxID=338321 RepID=I4BA11_TURPD|nr:Restriction endonuclease BglII [Turneriella parva DSM 21527]
MSHFEELAYHMAAEELEQEEEGAHDDIALEPGRNADSASEVSKFVNKAVLAKYDVYSYRNAASILKNSFPEEFAEIEKALLDFSITTKDIGLPGGNESTIPKKLSDSLRPKKWYETRIQGDLIIRVYEQSEEVIKGGKAKKHTLPPKEDIKLENYIDGHKIDYVKGKVALDMEWNSKDQTFDRDLYAFRLFHECGIISAAVLMTRSEKLNDVLKEIPQLNKDGSLKEEAGKIVPCIKKMGASTTWMGKLLYRMNAGRHGGCPVLVIGIKAEAVSDWPPKGKVGKK